VPARIPATNMFHSMHCRNNMPESAESHTQSSIAYYPAQLAKTGVFLSYSQEERLCGEPIEKHVGISQYFAIPKSNKTVLYIAARNARRTGVSHNNARAADADRPYAASRAPNQLCLEDLPWHDNFIHQIRPLGYIEFSGAEIETTPTEWHSIQSHIHVFI
jgi:hypothetical protein